MQHLQSWFSKNPRWIGHAARFVLSGDPIEQKRIQKLADLCLEEASLSPVEKCSLDFRALEGKSAGRPLALESLGRFRGINALAPKEPLQFALEGLTIVYGDNGSGKSGYVRTLRNLSGHRHARTLLGNVFEKSGPTPSCTVTYRLGEQTHCEEWRLGSGPVAALRALDIFDAHSGSIYITDKNEVTYEPRELRFLTKLTDWVAAVNQELKTRTETSPDRLPRIPNELSETPSGQWLRGLPPDVSEEILDRNCRWTDADDHELGELRKRAAEPSPAKQRQLEETRKARIRELSEKVRGWLESLSDERCKALLEAKRQVGVKKEAAEVAAQQRFADAPLQGVGSEVWRELWKRAREYSEQHAYKGAPFPQTDEQARCVLCQQSLAPDARLRLESFEKFVRDRTQAELDEASEILRKLESQLELLPDPQALETTAEAAHIQDREKVDLLLAVREAASRRRETLLQASQLEEVEPLPGASPWLEWAADYESRLDQQIEKLRNDEAARGKSEIEAKVRELEARQWLSNNREAIREESHRRGDLARLTDALKLANTTKLSNLKKKRAKKLISEAFVQRFRSELEGLGASRLRIELGTVGARQGRILHRLSLEGGEDESPANVFSEGELRIIGLAAFLADVQGSGNPTPFVFDDPISSLDQTFEAAVVRRLGKLAQTRQVIVFTHRISLLVSLLDVAKGTVTPKLVCIRREAWGTGQPGSLPPNVPRPQKALNNLLNERLAKARKKLETEGRDQYDTEAKAISSELRILVERIIEDVLLGGVVQRFRRNLTTKDKLARLAKIEEQDCSYLEGLMTKYSFWEHAQPVEDPCPLPLPDELKADMEKLRNWIEEFIKR